MPVILVTNDDGYRSEGIRSLAAALAPLGEVTIVAPINKGWNLGDDVTYSGTVAGAMEGALLGVQSLAVSLRQTRGDYDFTYAARAAATLAEALLQRPLPARTFLNVNVPKGAPKGFRVTVQAKRNHITSVAER